MRLQILIFASLMGRFVRTYLKRFIGLILIGVYFLSQAGNHFLHSFSHAHDEISVVTHNEKDEKDACHRKIYHNDSVHGCTHTEHVHPSIVKCHCSDHITYPHQVLGKIHISFPVVFVTHNATYYTKHFPKAELFNFSGRAPPHLI